jgi:hypothetical protein
VIIGPSKVFAHQGNLSNFHVVKGPTKASHHPTVHPSIAGLATSLMALNSLRNRHLSRFSWGPYMSVRVHWILVLLSVTVVEIV